MKRVICTCDKCNKEIEVLNHIFIEQDDAEDNKLEFLWTPSYDLCDACARELSVLVEHFCDGAAAEPEKVVIEIKEQTQDDEIVEEAEKSVKKKVDIGKIIALAKAGWSRDKIADEMGVKVSTVYQYLSDVKRGVIVQCDDGTWKKAK